MNNSKEKAIHRKNEKKIIKKKDHKEVKNTNFNKRKSKKKTTTNIVKSIGLIFQEYINAKTPSQKKKELEEFLFEINKVDISQIQYLINILDAQKIIDCLTNNFVENFLKNETIKELFCHKNGIKECLAMKYFRAVYLLSYYGKMKVCYGYITCLIFVLKMFCSHYSPNKSKEKINKKQKNEVPSSVLYNILQTLKRFLSVEHGTDFQRESDISKSFIIDHPNPCIQIAGMIYFYLSENFYVKELLDNENILKIFFNCLSILNKKTPDNKWKEFCLFSNLISLTFGQIFKSVCTDITYLKKIEKMKFLEYVISFLKKKKRSDKNENRILQIFRLYCIENIILLLFYSIKISNSLFEKIEDSNFYLIFENIMLDLYSDVPNKDETSKKIQLFMDKKTLSITGIFICFVSDLGNKLQTLDIKETVTNTEVKTLSIKHNPAIFKILVKLFDYYSEKNSKIKNYSERNEKYLCHFEFLNQAFHILINFPTEYFICFYKLNPFQSILRHFHFLPTDLQTLILQIFQEYVLFYHEFISVYEKEKNVEKLNELSNITRSYLNLMLVNTDVQKEKLESVNNVITFFTDLITNSQVEKNEKINIKHLLNKSNFNIIIVQGLKIHTNNKTLKLILKLLLFYLQEFDVDDYREIIIQKTFLETKSRLLFLYELLQKNLELIHPILSNIQMLAIQDQKQKWSLIPDLIKLIYQSKDSLILQTSIMFSFYKIFESNKNSTNTFRISGGFECLIEQLERVSYLESKDDLIFELIQTIILVLNVLLKINSENKNYFKNEIGFSKLFSSLNRLKFIQNYDTGLKLTMNLIQFSCMVLDIFQLKKKSHELSYFDAVKNGKLILYNSEVISDILFPLYGINFDKISSKLKKFFFRIIKLLTNKFLLNKRRLCGIGAIKSLLLNFTEIFKNGKHLFHKIVLNQMLDLIKYSSNVSELIIFFSFFKEKNFPPTLLEYIIEAVKTKKMFSNHSLYFPPDLDRKKSQIVFPKLIYRTWMLNGYTSTLWFSIESLLQEHRIDLIQFRSKLDKLRVFIRMNSNFKLSCQVFYKETKYKELVFDKFTFNKKGEWYLISFSHLLDVQSGGIHTHKFSLMVNGYYIQTVQQEFTIQESTIFSLFQNYFKTVLNNLYLEKVVIGKLVNKKLDEPEEIIEDIDEEKLVIIKKTKKKIEPSPSKKKKFKEKVGFSSYEIGNSYLIEGMIEEKDFFLMYYLGPNYIGDYNEDISIYIPNECYNKKSLDKFKDIYSMRLCSNGSDLKHLTDKIMFIFDVRDSSLATRLNTSTSSISSPSPTSIDNVENKRVSDLKKNIMFQTAKPVPNQSIRFSSIIPNSPKIIEFKDKDPLQISPNVQEFASVQSKIEGNIKIIRRFTLKTNLISFGGISQILTFIPIFKTEFRNKLLEFIYYLIENSRENDNQMRSLMGYHSLNFIIKQNYIPVDENLLISILRLCGFNEKKKFSNYNELVEDGLLTNRRAFKILLLDFHIWKKGDVNLQLKVYEVLNYMISKHKYKYHHIIIFRSEEILRKLLFFFSEINVLKKGINNLIIDVMIRIIKNIIPNPINVKSFVELQKYFFLTHPKTYKEETSNLDIENKKKADESNTYSSENFPFIEKLYRTNFTYPREKIIRIIYEKIVSTKLLKEELLEIHGFFSIPKIYVLLNTSSSIIRSILLNILGVYIYQISSIQEKYYNKTMIKTIIRQLKNYNLERREIDSLFLIFLNNRNIIDQKNVIYNEIQINFDEFLIVILNLINSIKDEKLKYKVLKVLYRLFVRGNEKMKKCFLSKNLQHYLIDFLNKKPLNNNKKILELILNFYNKYIFYLINYYGERKGLTYLEEILKSFYFIKGYEKKETFFVYVQKKIISKALEYFQKNYLFCDDSNTNFADKNTKWGYLFSKFCSTIVSSMKLFNKEWEMSENIPQNMSDLFSLNNVKKKPKNLTIMKCRKWYEKETNKMQIQETLFTQPVTHLPSLIYWILECIRICIKKMSKSRKNTLIQLSATKAELMLMNSLKQLIIHLLTRKKGNDQICGLLFILYLKSYSSNVPSTNILISSSLNQGDLLVIDFLKKDSKFAFFLIYYTSQLLKKRTETDLLFYLLEKVRDVVIKNKKMKKNDSLIQNMVRSVIKWEKEEDISLKKERQILIENKQKVVSLKNDVKNQDKYNLLHFTKKFYKMRKKIFKEYIFQCKKILYTQDLCLIAWKRRLKSFYLNKRNILNNFYYKNKKIEKMKNENISMKKKKKRKFHEGKILKWKINSTASENRVRNKLKISFAYVKRKNGIESLLNINKSNKILFGFSAYPGETLICVKPCERITPLRSQNGYLLIYTKYFYFHRKLSKDEEDTEFNESTENDDEDESTSILLRNLYISTGIDTSKRNLKIKIFQYDQVEEIHDRRYMLQDNSLEFFFNNGKSYFFVFDTKEDRKVIKRHLCDYKKCPNLKMYKTDKLQKKWKNGSISNFEYLIHLNILSGRSFNDLTQYPVFPYIIKNFNTENIDLENPNNFRDLDKPMGALSESRLEKAKAKYECLKQMNMSNPDDEKSSPFFWGTHYSTKMSSVLFYLIRLEPFSTCFWEMNDNKLDEPDRSYFSIQKAWESSSGEKNINTSDVRELIPEFYFLPEFLENFNNIRWKPFLLPEHENIEQQKNEVEEEEEEEEEKKEEEEEEEEETIKEVNNVILPKWSKNSVDYIRINRESLECNFVTKNLPKWIDIIFGYKQRGEEAVKSFNVYHPYCYETCFYKTKDEIELEAMKTMVLNYGQVPKQLFFKKHTTTSKNEFENMQIISKKTIKLLKSYSVNFFKEAIGDIQIYEDNTTVCVGKNKILLPKIKKKVEVSLSFSENQDEKQKTSSDMRFLSYEYEWNKALNIYSWNTGKIISTFFQSTKLDYYTCAMFSTDGSLLILGSDYCIAHIFKLDTDERIISRKITTLIGHTEAISAVYISNFFKICITGSKDCSIIIWDLSNFNFIQSIYFKSPIKIIEMNSQSGDIAIVTELNILYLYTLNGKLIRKKKFIQKKNYKNKITALKFSHFKMGFKKNLLYIGYDNGFLEVLDSFTLKKYSRLHPKEVNVAITNIVLNPSQSTLGIADQNGTNITLTTSLQ